MHSADAQFKFFHFDFCICCISQMISSTMATSRRTMNIPPKPNPVIILYDICQGFIIANPRNTAAIIMISVFVGLSM